jgi:prepilin-type N-terminal cleavage/methylation domain-containing protein
MESASPRSTHRRSGSGFTVLELLVVVALLAIVAGSVVASYGNLEVDARSRIGANEMLALKQALLQFRADTGAFPGQGEFALEGDGVGRVSFAHLPFGGSASEKRAIFASPASFLQLLLEPKDGNGQPVRSFDPITRRGWRGPYIGRNDTGLVSLRGFDPGSDDPEDWSPEEPPLLGQVYAVADPFVRPPAGAAFAWTTLSGEKFSQKGRPYLLFDLDNRDARIVGLGENGEYEPSSGSDDQVLDLLK